MATGDYTYELPGDKQRLEQDARTMARKEVQDNYPNVLRTRNDIENHARALCEQAEASKPDLTNDFGAYYSLYTTAFTQAYEQEMENLDANQGGRV